MNPDIYYQPNASSQRDYRRVVIFSAIALLFIGFVYWLSQRSRLTIVLPDGGDYSIVITHQESMKTSEHTSKGTKTVFLRKGDYQVLVTAGNASYYAPLSTKGFFLNTSTTATLVAEKEGIFVGDGTSGCAFYEKVLVSYPCLGDISRTAAHQPAKSSSPSYSLRASFDQTQSGDISGEAETDEGHLLIARLQNDTGDVENALLKVGVSGTKATLTKQRVIDQINDRNTYSINNYKKGFVVYSPQSYRAYYFESLADDEPSSLETYFANRPDSLNAVEFSAGAYGMVVAYSNTNDTERGFDETVLRIGDEGRYDEFKLSRALRQIELCGENLLCAIEKDNLRVFSIDDKKLKPAYSITGIRDFEVSRTNNQIYALTGSNVITFDTQKRTGFSSYQLEDFAYQNLIAEDEGYILQVSIKNTTLAILVGDQAGDNDVRASILTFAQEPAIKTVTAYQDNIYLAPDVGEVVYLGVEEGYGYEQARVDEVSSIIAKIIKESSIDTKRFNIYNLLVPGNPLTP